MSGFVTDSGQLHNTAELTFWNPYTQSPHFDSEFSGQPIKWEVDDLSSPSALSLAPSKGFPSIVSGPDSSPSFTNSPPASLKGGVSTEIKLSSLDPTDCEPEQRHVTRLSSKKAAFIFNAKPESAASSSRAEKKRERNRIAAAKCRKKTRAETGLLMEREQQLTKQRKDLIRNITLLKEQLYDLEQLCFGHFSCDCAQIRGYLLNKLDLVPKSRTRYLPAEKSTNHASDLKEDSLFDLVHLA